MHPHTKCQQNSTARGHVIAGGLNCDDDDYYFYMFLTADVQELVFVIWFGIEFVVRVWSAGYRSRYRQISGRLRFIRRPLCIVGKSKQFSCSLPRFENQWLKCNGTQGNAVPHLQFMAQSVSPPQIVIMLGKGTRPLSGAQT